MTGFWTRILYISWQDWSFSRKTQLLATREKKRGGNQGAYFESPSSPNHAIMLSIISCGISIDVAESAGPVNCLVRFLLRSLRQQAALFGICKRLLSRQNRKIVLLVVYIPVVAVPENISVRYCCHRKKIQPSIRAVDCNIPVAVRVHKDERHGWMSVNRCLT